MSNSSKVILGIVVVVVIAIGGWYFASGKNKNNSYSSSSNSGSNMNMSSNGSSSSSNSPSPTATDAVTIQNFAFSPANISVKAGTMVTWTNKDSVAHTVTETDGQSGPNSGDVNPNGTYTFTFSKAGTYHYHCSIHSEMVGTVTVTS